MKKIFQKSNILSFIVGALLFGCIGTVAAYNLLAKDVKYTPSDSTWEVDNVKDAIDELYIKSNKEILNRFTTTLRAATSHTVNAEALLNFDGGIKSNYKYFKITGITPNANASYCKCLAWSTKQSESIELSLNSEYEVRSNTDNYSFSGIMAYAGSKSNSSFATCLVGITFYNK